MKTIILLAAFTAFSSVLKTKEYNHISATAQQLLNVGDVAPQFNLLASDGKSYKLSDFKGKLVVLDFWAMWCAPCKKKMPKIQELKNTYSKKGVEVISLLAMNKGAEEKAKTYFANKGYNLKLLYGNDELTSNYRLKFLPTVTVIGKNGKILYHSTTPNPDEFEDIKALIAKNQ